jgi:RNA 3'-terminal phosphate cyclase-like protein
MRVLVCVCECASGVCVGGAGLRILTTLGFQQVDTIRTVTLPLLRRFGLTEGIELKILKRGCAPLGGGEVRFTCPTVRALAPVRLLEMGKIKRVRGLAYSANVSPQLVNRIVDAARARLNALLPDVYIYTDHYKGADAGKSPGFGLTLVAETTEGCLFSAEVAARPGEPPEDVGTRATHFLLEEISRRGCIDTPHQASCLLYMVLCSEDVSKVRLGRLSPFTIAFLRDLRTFFGVTFKIAADPEDGTTMCGCAAARLSQTLSPPVSLGSATCLGIGFTNTNKKIG